MINIEETKTLASLSEREKGELVGIWLKDRAKINVSPVDMVNHPPHYTNKNPETIDMIRAVLTKEEFIGGLKWQILKYRDRAHDKGDLEKDMAKAKFYYDLLRKEQE